jgi:hypothetical protein
MRDVPPGRFSFRNLWGPLGLTLWLQLVATLAAGLFFLLGIQTKETGPFIAAGLCASLSPVACAGGLGLLGFGGERGRRGPWPLALISLAGLNALSTALVLFGAVAGSFAYQFQFAVPLMLCFYVSAGLTVLTFFWGVVAIFQPPKEKSSGHTP